MDDWICTRTGPIVRISWWGVLLNREQFSKQWRYYIAIYRNIPGTCRPEQEPIYRACVRPDVIRYTGRWDCRQQRVFYFSAPLPVPFRQEREQHYWLQISEADKESARPGAEDFRWSAHRDIKRCPAAQFPPFTQPILDLCDEKPDDLAFCLYSRGIVAQVNLEDFQGRRDAIVELRTRGGNVAGMEHVQIDDDGMFETDFDVPDGNYDVVLRIGSALPAVQKDVEFGDGSVRVLSFFDIFFGDIDGDGEVSLFDFGILVKNFGKVGEE
ncbi:MAG: hypothetical protein RMM08_01840 [Armatimonadota bacterium]|nr:hypothetical protein [Armatimonadota bacterium]